MDTKQFEKNKKWINKRLAKKFPGVKMLWDADGEPTLQIQDEQEPITDKIIVFAQELVRECGGEYDFYPEQAYAS